MYIISATNDCGLILARGNVFSMQPYMGEFVNNFRYVDGSQWILQHNLMTVVDDLLQVADFPWTLQLNIINLSMTCYRSLSFRVHCNLM